MSNYGVKLSGEIKVCNEVYGEDVCSKLCKEYPKASYIERDEKGNVVPKGCLAAHILLSLYELHKIYSKIRNWLVRLSSCNEIELTLMTLLHDIGKLDESYLRRYKYKHNLTSAYLALKVIKNLLGDEKASAIAIAIFLHHEFFEWRDIGFRLTLCDDYKSQEIKLNTQKTLNFLKAILKVYLRSKYCILRNESFGFMDRFISEFGKVLKETFKYRINNHELCNEIKSKFFRYALPLYYILYIVDNRAASARNTYWEETPHDDINRPYIKSL